MFSSVELLEWLLNTLLFALAGVVFGHVLANRENYWREGMARGWGYLFLLWFLLNAVRFFLTFSSYPLLSRIGLKSNLREATFLAFGGLRGAIGIALALALEAEVVHSGASQEYRFQVEKLFAYVGGVAFLTLVINGTLAGPLLVKLGLADSTPMRKRIVEHFRKAAKEKVLNKYIFLLTDPRFRNTTDFALIAHHVPILQDLTVDELQAAVEKNHANTNPNTYKEPRLTSVLPYLLQKEKSAVDLEGGNVLLNSSKANAASLASVPENSTRSSVGIDFDELKALYASDEGPSTANALISAAATGDLEALEKLLALPSVDVNKGDYDKRTAIHLAAGEGHVDVIKLLIQHNADVNVEDRFGNRPLDDAQRGKRAEVINLLRQHNALPGSNAQQSADLIAAAAAGDVEEVQKLLDSEDMKEYAINASDYDRRTCLHVAAVEGHADVVKLLCENGASVQVSCLLSCLPTSMNVTSSSLRASI
jgi:ankyrin repeat protein